MASNRDQRAAIDGYLNEITPRKVLQDGDLEASLELPTDEIWLESMQLAAIFQRFEATGRSITSVKVSTLGMFSFCHQI
jgi:hypothetical protein